ncbi:hypothetical protein B4099_0936 [Heyndrickxia coagulans]|uniref:Uncharacterized protein n=1 Tax=Heyndrickxia coagulans TaxID=1398 RepID=A0A150JXS8_HEYCO|nr:hypothetical protein B4099_0936 [Heyndrickxia coagulans]
MLCIFYIEEFKNGHSKILLDRGRICVFNGFPKEVSHPQGM